VALVTDGRLSGASGKVLSAIHVSPEASLGGPLSRVRSGDVIRIDAVANRLQVLIEDHELAAREPARQALEREPQTNMQELFGFFRRAVSDSTTGASVFGVN
jgi:phosphogluconate dehydratase